MKSRSTHVAAEEVAPVRRTMIFPRRHATDRNTLVGSHYWAIRRTSAPLRKLWLNIQLEDVANVPTDGPVLLAANHLSFIDSVLLMYSLPRRVSFLGKAEYLRSTGSRKLFPAAGMIPVDRTGTGLLASLRTAEQRLAGGEVVGLFPEGTRSRDLKLHRGHAGVAHLALRSGAPIVPVGIIGSERVQPPGASTPKFREPVTVRFGSPLDLGPWQSQRPSRSVKQAITAEVMASIATLSGQTYDPSFAVSPDLMESAPS